MIEWLVIPGYFGASYITYRIFHHVDLKNSYTSYLADITKHGCRYTHPNVSHEKWAYDLALENRDAKDFAVSSIFWPVALVCLVMDWAGSYVSRIPSRGKIAKQVQKAEAEFQLQQFAEKEGLPWSQNSSKEK